MGDGPEIMPEGEGEKKLKTDLGTFELSAPRHCRWPWAGLAYSF